MNPRDSVLIHEADSDNIQLVFSVSDKMDGDTITFRGGMVQVLSTFAIASLSTLIGFVFAWPSYNVLNFSSDDTVLDTPMNSMEVALLGSLTNLGAFAITPFTGILINSVGRKYTAILLGLPFVISWTVISVTTSVPLVIAVMGLAGVGAGGQGPAFIYIAEISQNSIRGALTSTATSGLFLGVLLSYIMGGYLSYYQVVYTKLSLSVLYIVMVTCLKESPVHLLRKGKKKEAVESIAFYRQVHVSSKVIEEEMAKIRLQLDPRVINRLDGNNDIAATKELMEPSEGENKHLSQWQALMRSPSSKRALITNLIVMFLVIMMGNIPFQVYAETLFREAIPSMEPNECSIYLATGTMAAGIMCAYLIEKCGRKLLMILTTTGSGLCLILLGLQMQLHYAPPVFTAVVIYLYSIIFNLGAALIPYVLAAEFYLPEVRGLCSSTVMACAWLSNFTVVLIFTPIVDALGLTPLFYGFAFISLVGALYTYFFLPETKGLPVDEIQRLFMKKTKKKITI